MSKFTREMVDDYADKLLIGLTPEENKQVLDEFEIIDKNIDIINQIPGIENVEVMTHCLTEFEADFREDMAEESSKIEDILKNSERVDDRQIEVVKVVG